MSVTLYLTNSGSNDVDFFNIYTGSFATGSNLIASNVDRAELTAGFCVDVPSQVYTVESATTFCTSRVYVAVDAFDCALTVSASNEGGGTPTPVPQPVPAPVAPTPAPVAPSPVPQPVPAPVSPTPVPTAPVPAPVAPTPVPAPTATFHYFYVSPTATGTNPCDTLSPTTQVYWADPEAITSNCGEAEFMPPSGTTIYEDCAGTTPFTGGGSDHVVEQPGTGDLYYASISAAGVIGETTSCD